MIFKRKMNDKELQVFNKACSHITKKANEICNKDNEYAFRHFNAITEAQKDRVLHDVDQFSYVACNNYSVFTKLHPFTWIGLGLTNPWHPAKNIALNYKALKDVKTAIEIITHEFSHAQLGTIDGLAGEGISSDNFDERIMDAWVWTFLF